MMRLIRSLAPFRWLIAGAVLLGAGTVASGIGLMATSAYLISSAALHPSIADLQVAIVGVRFFGIARGVLRYLERLVSHKITLKLLTEWRVWFYQAIEPLAPARLATFHSGDVLARAVADIETLQDFYVRAVAPPAVAFVVGLGTALWLAKLNPALALVLLLGFALAGPALAVVVFWFSRSPAADLANRRGALDAAIVDSIQGMAELVALGQADRAADEIAARSKATASAQRMVAQVNAAQGAAGGLIAQLTMIAVLGVSVSLATQGQLNPVYLAAAALATAASFEAVYSLPQAAQSFTSARAASRRLHELVDVLPTVRDPSTPASPPEGYGLELREVRFSYDTGGLPALGGITFCAQQGKHIAIVGPSGAGKTTLANLLVRFWEYQEGEILLGGTSIRNYSQTTVREMIGVIQQRTYLFNGTIRDNLIIARPNCTTGEMVDASRRAQIHDWISSLPAGYDTHVGERGMMLSGGERKRLAVARAILRQTPILVLDEPTANLDAATERALLVQVMELFRDRTVLLITHRLVGLEAMDRILVLDAGRLVEQGTHQELVDRGGVYSRLWNLQNRALLRVDS